MVASRLGKPEELVATLNREHGGAGTRMAEEKSTDVVAVNVGDEVAGAVEHIAPYGAFVRLGTGQKAMIHISELSHGFVKKVEDVLELGQNIRAKVIKIDERGRIDLSLKAMQPKEARPQPKTEDFEKRLSQFLKQSDEKIADLNSKMKNPKGTKKRVGKK
jgi:S1 RNA binding domain protein